LSAKRITIIIIITKPIRPVNILTGKGRKHDCLESKPAWPEFFLWVSEGRVTRKSKISKNRKFIDSIFNHDEPVHFSGPIIMTERGTGAQLLLPLLLSSVVATAVAQSNYDQVENSIDFPNPDRGLPESTVLDGKVTKLDELSPVIFLNRTKAALNCAAGYMQVSA